MPFSILSRISRFYIRPWIRLNVFNCRAWRCICSRLFECLMLARLLSLLSDYETCSSLCKSMDFLRLLICRFCNLDEQSFRRHLPSSPVSSGRIFGFMPARGISLAFAKCPILSKISVKSDLNAAACYCDHCISEKRLARLWKLVTEILSTMIKQSSP